MGPLSKRLARFSNKGYQGVVGIMSIISDDAATAVKVGTRHGKPVVLQVAAERLHAQRHEFFGSHNGVWLTAYVPTEFLSLKASV